MSLEGIASELADPLALQAFQVLWGHVSGDVLPREHRGLEDAELGVHGLHGGLQVAQVLVHHPPGSQLLCDGSGVAPPGDQLGLRGDVYAVDVRVADLWGGGGHADVPRARLLGHQYELTRRGPAHDGVVYEQHPATLELGLDDAQLHPHALAPLHLSRHDERAADVVVLLEAVPVQALERACELQRRRPRGVRHRDHHVDAVVVAVQPADLLCQALAHAQARLVHAHAIHDGVRPCEVDKLEQARAQDWCAVAQLPVQALVGTRALRYHRQHQHCLARRHVAQEVESE
mmetsp:Transcript_37620/g.100832  ORF Transcript_37620/g.100832 Transcript_37620/m.100832 type:complete len:289 (+) Transcript_37620:196-1062(+)